MVAPNYWLSPAPSRCDLCQRPLNGVFYDAKTAGGPWGCICPTCHTGPRGIGRVGPGLGQRYELQEDGRYLKTEG
jgi:hypothetical protein